MIHEQDAIVLAAVLSDQVRKGPLKCPFWIYNPKK